jgi:hypothetical protein
MVDCSMSLCDSFGVGFDFCNGIYKHAMPSASTQPDRSDIFLIKDMKIQMYDPD